MKTSVTQSIATLLLTLSFIFSCCAYAQDNEVIPAGEYRIDPAHTSLLFRVNHLGFSMYTARFTGVEAQLTFDPQAPTNAKLNVTVAANSLKTDFPTPDVLDFDKELTGKNWLDAETYPHIKYRSTAVSQRQDGKLVIKGELTLHGITKPVELIASYNGGYVGHPMDKNARIGFSATGKLNRSDFGISFGIPAPGTTMGVSDAVEIIIETEFSGPNWKG